jgi:TolB-like protein
MKRLILFLMIIGTLALGGCAQRILVQPTVDMTRYPRLAVLPFTTDSAFSTIGNQLADEIILNLLKQAPALEIMERTRIDMLLQEQNLARQGITTPESAVSVGRLMGVQAIITGSITLSIGEIRPTPDTVQRVVSGMCTLRLIDTETGKILWGDHQESQYSIFILESGQSRVILKTDQEMVEVVMKELAQNLAQAFYPHYELRY